MDRVVAVSFKASLINSSQRLKDNHDRIRLALKYNNLEPQQSSSIFAPPSEIVVEADDSNSQYLDEIVSAIVFNKNVQLNGVYSYLPFGFFCHYSFYLIGFIGGRFKRSSAERVIEAIMPKRLEGELSVDGHPTYEIFYERASILDFTFEMSRL